jgi:mono/diheme cytochrome c family protein
MAKQVLLLGALLTVIGCRGNRSELPPVHLQQNMDFQERGDAQERNDFFPDGRVMRKPPVGTVAWGDQSMVADPHYLKADDHLYRGRNEDGTLAEGLPGAVKLNEVLLQRGEERFNIYCQPCHGQTGHGDGPATRRGGGFSVKPASLHLSRLRPERLGYFYDVITNGKGQMRSYRAQIGVEDRWAIAAWVRTLQVSHSARADEVPTEANRPQPPAGGGKAP